VRVQAFTAFFAMNAGIVRRVRKEVVYEANARGRFVTSFELKWVCIEIDRLVGPVSVPQISHVGQKRWISKFLRPPAYRRK